MTEYYLDMGYKGYRTKCDVPDLIYNAVKNGINFIGIQTIDGRYFLININRCDAVSYDSRAKEFNDDYLSKTIEIATKSETVLE